jgi:hypothetical protein
MNLDTLRLENKSRLGLEIRNLEKVETDES